jgi:hypothetical protein
METKARLLGHPIHTMLIDCLAASPGLASPLDAINIETWYRHPGSNGGPLDPQSSALTN